MTGCPFQSLFFCWGDNGICCCPLCGVGVWGGHVKQTAGSGQSCIALRLCHGTLCLASIEEFLKSRFASCGDTCNDIVLAPLREGEIPAPTFEAGCKHLLPHAEPELNPDGPSLAVSLRPPSLLPPCLQGCFLTASSLTVCFWTDLYPSVYLSAGPPCAVLLSSALSASSLPSLVQLLRKHPYLLCLTGSLLVVCLDNENIFRLLHGFSCLLFGNAQIVLWFILNVRIIL